MNNITNFENITDFDKTLPISGTLTDVSNFIISESLKKLIARFPIYGKFPDKYGKFIRTNLNPWLFYIYMCQLITKYKIGFIYNTDLKQVEFKNSLFTNKYQKDFNVRFEALKRDIRENLKFTAKFCGKMKFKQNFDTHVYGLFESQLINSDDIDMNGFMYVAKVFGVSPGKLTMSDDNHMIKMYCKKIVEFHVLLELYQSIVHPKIMELITEFAKSYILKNQTMPKNSIILINNKNFKNYPLVADETKNEFYFYESHLCYEAYYTFADLYENISAQIQEIDINKHLEIIFKLYGAILNFNQSAMSIKNDPYETELYDFLIDYRIYEYKFTGLYKYVNFKSSC